MKWSAKDPLPLLPVVTDAPWQIIQKKQANKKKVQSVFVVPVNYSKKRKVENEENVSASIKKTKTVQSIMASADSSSPSGLIWDGKDYSCAYDALFTASGLLTQSFGLED